MDADTIRDKIRKLYGVKKSHYVNFELRLDQLMEIFRETMMEVIGEESSYNNMCEHCNDWDKGRNDLIEEQCARARKLLEPKT